MNWKTWLLLFVALLAGSAASYAVKTAFFVEREESSDSAATEIGVKETLLVAKGFIAAGTELNAQNTRLVLTAEKDLPRDGVFTFGDTVGRKVARDLNDGEPITLFDIEESDEAQLEGARFVPPGCVVAHVEICSASKTNGSRNYLATTKLDKIIKVGDLVEFLVVKEDSSEKNSQNSDFRRRLVSKSIATDVPIFEVSDASQFGSAGTNRTAAISALLSAEQLEAVRKASDEGKLKVVLHNESSESLIELTPAIGQNAPLAVSHNPEFKTVSNAVQDNGWQTPRLLISDGEVLEGEADVVENPNAKFVVNPDNETVESSEAVASEPEKNFLFMNASRRIEEDSEPLEEGFASGSENVLEISDEFKEDSKTEAILGGNESSEEVVESASEENDELFNESEEGSDDSTKPGAESDAEEESDDSDRFIDVIRNNSLQIDLATVAE